MAQPELNPDTARPRLAFASDPVLLTIALVAAFIAYAGTLAFGFVFDDRQQIVQNPFVQSWGFVPRYFASHVWSYQRPHMLANYYRPVFLLWLRLNHALFGLSAWKWHLASVSAHLAVTSAVFLLTRRITGRPAVAFVAAVVFGLHPVHIEAVAYLSGAAEVLSALLTLAALLCFLKSRDAPARGWLAGSLALFALALLAKETAIVLPALIFALLWLELPSTGRRPVDKAFRSLIPTVGPYLGVTLIYLVARALALKGLSHAITPLPLSTLVATWPGLIIFYLRLLIWPVGLSAYYDTPYATRFALRTVLVPALLILGATAAIGVWARGVGDETAKGRGVLSERPAIIFASLWLALPLVPTLNLRVFPQGEIAHDRYLYLPSVGFAILLALAIQHLRPFRLMGRPAAPVLATAALALLLGLATAAQSAYWADELSLYARAHRIAPQNVSATTSLAAVAAERDLYPAALELYQQALARSPDFWQANVNLGYLYFKLGDLARADHQLSRSIEIDRSDGDQYVALALIRLQEGRPSDAEGLVRRALVARPEGPGYHYVLGLALEAQSRLSDALAEFRQELARDPAHAGAAAKVRELEARLKTSARRHSSKEG